MKIVEEKLFNILIPTEKEFLVDKQDLESENINYSKEIYLPKAVTLEYCLEHYIEIEKVDNENGI